jgi:uncharacterized membrane protein
MGDIIDELYYLKERLRLLESKSNAIKSDINYLRERISKLESTITNKAKGSDSAEQSQFRDEISVGRGTEKQVPKQKAPVNPFPQQNPFYRSAKKKKPIFDANWEKIVGENLINKVGILILIIGLGIGVKYAIDHNLISPATRIILAYIVSFSILFVSFKIKKKFEDYSAVLLSGSMAANYFITYFAYDTYGLISQILAFSLMVVFTVFTVYSALRLNKSIIANIGLVGAYGIPFLLSSGSGRADILFSYISIINFGILVIAFKKDWKSLFYSSFSLTWLIFLAWFFNSYSYEAYFTEGILFSTIIFFTFYTTIIAFKTLEGVKLRPQDIIMLLSNSFLYFMVGYAVVYDIEIETDLTGLFTALNALVHLIASLVIKRKDMEDKSLYYFAIGLAIAFGTMTIPVQFDGNWVTLLWIFEAAILLWVSRKNQLYIYETFSNIVLVISAFSLFGDWIDAYQGLSKYDLTPFLSIEFFSSLIFAAVLGYITYLNFKFNRDGREIKRKSIATAFDYMIPILFVGILYLTFFIEVSHWFGLMYHNSEITTDREYHNTNIMILRDVVLLLYTLLFSIAGILINKHKLKIQVLQGYIITINGILILVFMTFGLFNLSLLRENYIDYVYSNYYNISIFNIIIRYIALAVFGALLFYTYRFKSDIVKYIKEADIEIVSHTIAVWLLSSELIHWLDFTGIENIYKVGLTILWGLYAIYLITIGIKKNKRNLRVLAIVLLGISVAKLVFYDTVQLDTIKKTILYVSLGVVLLIVSFLYNKFKNTIFPPDEK